MPLIHKFLGVLCIMLAGAMIQVAFGPNLITELPLIVKIQSSIVVFLGLGLGIGLITKRGKL